MASRKRSTVSAVREGSEIGSTLAMRASAESSEAPAMREPESRREFGLEVAKKGTGGLGQSSSPSSSDTAVICNITDQRWWLQRTHGAYVIAACEPGAEYALTEVKGRSAWLDHGDSHKTELPISAKQLAEDLAREINSDAGESCYFGVFVCAGPEPTDEELIEAHDKLKGFYRLLVASADRQWERTHNVVLISDLERRAAKALKLERDWCYEAQQRIECPACGENLKQGVAVCRVCGAIIDRKRAAQFGLAATDAPTKPAIGYKADSASTAN